MSNLNLLLDIEGTIIESLDDRRFMTANIERIQKTIRVLEPATITIFSFAWHTIEDVDWTLMKEFEEMFGMKINIFPKNDLMPIFKKHFRIADEMDFHDICNSKEIGFMMLLRECSEDFLNIPKMFKIREWDFDIFREEISFLLIDDKATSSDITFKNSDIHVFGRTAHPEKLLDM